MSRQVLEDFGSFGVAKLSTSLAYRLGGGLAL